MGTTADKLNRLIGTKQAIREAIVSKGVSVSDQDTFNSYASKIRAIPQEGGGVTTQPSAGAVNFRDYDGTVLHAYSKDEFLALTAMPALPTQPKLTCQGWNYTLEDAQAYVEEYGVLEVGATYITDDGKTRLYIKITADGWMDVPLYISQTVANGVTIDWGDGSPTETLSGTGNVNTTHIYADVGDYTISLDPVDGCQLGFGSGSSGYCIMGSTDNRATLYRNKLQAIEIGKGVTSIRDYAFYYCYSLSSVVIPSGVTFIGSYAFHTCYHLSSAVIPNGVTVISNYAFYNCYSITSVVIPSSVTSISSYVFRSCESLSSVVIPSSVTSISAFLFENCNFSSLVIPNGVTSIGGYAFQNCYLLSSLVIPNGVTSIGGYAFQNCYTLSSVVIPSSVTSIGTYAFQNCWSIPSLVIPSGVTSISNYAFSNCYSITSVVIPSSVTSIGSNAFYACLRVKFYDFSRHTAVPTLGNTNAFSSIPSDCKIIVPPHLYDEWKNSSGWNTYAANIWTDYEPTECTEMTILNLPERVIYGQIDTITFDVEAITNGVDSKGNRIENVPWSGFVNFNIGKNLSDTDVTKELTYTYLGNSVVFTVIHGAYLTNAIICKYNVTSTTSATTLLYSSFANMAYFGSMDIDGVDTPIAKTHTFASTGEHYVAFKIAEGASITNLYRMFSGCASLRYVDCSELDMSAVTSTSTSNGTAYMFYGCIALQQIILPDTVKYLGYYMFYNCVSVTSLTIKASTAPTLYGSSTWGGSSYYLGYLNRTGKRNKLYVPSGATGYVQTGSWANLYNTSYCGFTKVESADL